MDALPILMNLVGRNLVRFHVRGIGVATATCFRNMRREYRGVGILDWFYTVISVAAYARRRFLVTLGDFFAVHARCVLGLLVHANCRVVMLHEFGIAVTFSAKRLDLAGTGCSDETLSRIHRSIVVLVVRVSSVTAGMTNP